MQELAQILKHEQRQQEIVQDVKIKADDSISRKKNELAEKLAKDGCLTEEAKRSVFDYHQRQISEMETAFKRDLKEGSQNLQKKARENFKTTVGYLLKELISLK